jgi:hypothetical protein
VAAEEPLTSFDDGMLSIDFVQREITIDGLASTCNRPNTGSSPRWCST